MANSEEYKEAKKLGLAFATLAGLHPAQRRQLEDGLLVALAGCCQNVADPVSRSGRSFWKIRTSSLYRVRLEGVPVRWSCSCPQGRGFGPVAGDFFGHPGRVCKHVAAVALCLEAMEVPGRPADLLGFVRRVCAAGAGGHGQLVREVPRAEGVRLVRVERGGVSLTLQKGRVQSGDLAWGTPISPRLDGGVDLDVELAWAMDGRAGERYREWVAQLEEITEKGD